MAKLKTNQALVPFLGQKMHYIGGLDPLGYQNASGSAYTQLLPGLNNVTGLIRSYSFYCWLLDQYASGETISQDPKAQRKYIRKAEYIIALVAHYAQIPGVSGTLYAGKQFENNSSTFDLITGTYNEDGSTTNTYWQNSMGVFGQYYVGSLRQIGLIEDPVNKNGERLGIYRITKAREGENRVDGEQLSRTFDQNISSTSKALFLSCVEKEEITLQQIELLSKEFNLRVIPENSLECETLIQLLVDVDEPGQSAEKVSQYRRSTFKHLLGFCNTGLPFSDRAFTYYAYNQQGGEQKDPTMMGWYYYQFNEYWQLGCLGILDGLLKTLKQQKGGNWMLLNELLELLVSTITQKMEEDADVSVQVPFSLKDLAINYTEEELATNLLLDKHEDHLYHGWLLVLKVYLTNKDNLSVLEETIHENELGSNYEGLKFYQSITEINEVELKSFIESFLYRFIINRHQLVAYRKMGAGQESTQKFLVEDGLIRLIDVFGTSFTAPRIGSLITFMKDLHLVDKNDALTSKGQELIAELEQNEH